MKKKNPNFKICIIAAICLLIGFSMSGLYFHSSLPLFLKNISIKIEHDSDFRFYFNLIYIVTYFIWSTFWARIGYVVALKKGEDPWRWAKYCFLFNVLALLVLVTFENNKARD